MHIDERDPVDSIKRLLDEEFDRRQLKITVSWWTDDGMPESPRKRGVIRVAAKDRQTGESMRPLALDEDNFSAAALARQAAEAIREWRAGLLRG
jgi:hypothetical protein